MTTPHFKNVWLTDHPNPLPGGKTVIDTLVEPPASAVAAQERDLARAQDESSATDIGVLAWATENRDTFRDTRDAQSILRPLAP